MFKETKDQVKAFKFMKLFNNIISLSSLLPQRNIMIQLKASGEIYMYMYQDHGANYDLGESRNTH